MKPSELYDAVIKQLYKDGALSHSADRPEEYQAEVDYLSSMSVYDLLIVLSKVKD